MALLRTVHPEIVLDHHNHQPYVPDETGDKMETDVGHLGLMMENDDQEERFPMVFYDGNLEEWLLELRINLRARHRVPVLKVNSISSSNNRPFFQEISIRHKRP